MSHAVAVLSLFAFADVALNDGQPASEGEEVAVCPTEPGPPTAIDGPGVWGIVGLRGFAFGKQVAPNGLTFDPIFTLELNLNLWLCRSAGVYLYSDTAFWGQRAAPGITTNAKQGMFDFSKREFDLAVGVAWNYWGPLEFRAFAYSFNNLNRGESTWRPAGYADGAGVEQRFYLSEVYADLGTADYDLARASFVGIGYCPTKELVDADGVRFKPGPFLHVYLTYDLCGPQCYVYADGRLTGNRSFSAELFRTDAGLAGRPFGRHLEFRIGASTYGDPGTGDGEVSGYGQIRYQF